VMSSQVTLVASSYKTGRLGGETIQYVLIFYPSDIKDDVCHCLTRKAGALAGAVLHALKLGRWRGAVVCSNRVAAS